MRKTTRITESDIKRLVKRVINEEQKQYPPCGDKLRYIMGHIKASEGGWTISEYESEDNSDFVLIKTGFYDACLAAKKDIFK